jgi:hypothetical protein
MLNDVAQMWSNSLGIAKVTLGIDLEFVDHFQPLRQQLAVVAPQLSGGSGRSQERLGRLESGSVRHTKKLGKTSNQSINRSIDQSINR